MRDATGGAADAGTAAAAATIWAAEMPRGSSASTVESPAVASWRREAIECIQDLRERTATVRAASACCNRHGPVSSWQSVAANESAWYIGASAFSPENHATA